jgi:hypothetical protein
MDNNAKIEPGLVAEMPASFAKLDVYEPGRVFSVREEIQMEAYCV